MAALQCIAVLLILNSVSCNCGNNTDTDTDTGGSDANKPSNYNIHMQVPNGPFMGDNKIVEVAFTLADANQEAILEGLKLNVTLQEIGGVGSQISYPNATAVSQVDRPLQEVLNLTKLTTATSPCKVPFTLIVTDLSITQIEAKFKLLDQTDNLIQEGTVSWKAVFQPIDLSLTLTSPASLQDDHKTISLLIQNKGVDKVGHNHLKLKITRQEGESAELLYGRKSLGSQDSYLVDLPMLAGQAILPYELTIQPDTDLKAAFSIELIYQGKNVGTPITITWNKEHPLEMSDFSYDRTTGDLFCNIYNKGTEKVSQVKVTCIAQTPGAELARSGNPEIIIGNLKPSEGKKKFRLGELNLGGANKSAVFAFVLAFEQAGTQKKMPALIQTFTQADIDVLLDAYYDKDSEEVIVEIDNVANDKAVGLRLMYKNKSAEAQAKLATLDRQQEHILDIGDLAGKGNYKKKFVLDLKEAEAATFYFEVQYDNNPLKTTTVLVEAPLAELSIDILKPTKDQDAFTLYGADNEIKLSIKEYWYNKRTIKIEDLQVVIQQIAGDAATISTTPGGPAIAAMSGADLGNLGDKLTLYVNPAPGSKSATFNFQLQYKGKDIANPVTVSWQEYNMWIHGIQDRLVGDEEGNFKVICPAPVDLTTLTATLESEQGTVFEWKGLDGTIEEVSLPLNQVIANLENPISFKITHKNGQQKAKVNAVIKRGTIELARKEFIWVNQGISLEIEINEGIILVDNDKNIIIKNNTNNPLDLRTIQVKHTNTADCPVTLGKGSGATIQETLAALTGQNELPANEKVTMKIKLAASDLPQDKLIAGSTLVFLDSHGEVLQKKYLLFTCISVIFEKIGYTVPHGLNQAIEDNQDKIEFLVKILPLVEETLAALEILRQKVNEIAQQDAGYQNLLKETQELVSAIGKSLNEPRIAIQQFIFQETARKLKEMNGLKKAINQFSELIEGEEDVKNIISLLSANYDLHAEMHEQSIKGLYQHYHETMDSLKDSLDQAGITVLNPLPQDLPGIREVKTCYQAMANDLPALKQKAQEGFKLGFEMLKKAIANKQQEIQEAVQQKVKNQSHQLLNEQKLLLDALLAAEGELLQTSLEDLGLDAATWSSFLAVSYQNLAEQFQLFTKFDNKVYLSVTLGVCLELLDGVKVF